MDNRARESPSDEVSVLIQRVKTLQREKEKILSSDPRSEAYYLMEKIRDFLARVAKDCPSDNEDLEGLVELLFLVIRSQTHDKECNGRDRARLSRDLAVLQKRIINLEYEFRLSERQRKMLEIERDALKEGLVKSRRKTKR